MLTTTVADVQRSIEIAEQQNLASQADTTALPPHPNDVPIDFVKLALQPQYQTNEQKLLACSAQTLVVLTRIMEIAQATLDHLMVMQQGGAAVGTAQEAAEKSVGRKMFAGKSRR